ncbi:MAG: hypothetical protein EP302_04965 [Bacteroidetes bacterium]|nr:MAG: hypothetical protein EP302_04965 [Bacteroidota bacterium]
MKNYSVFLFCASLALFSCSNDSESDPGDNTPVPQARTSIPDSNFESALVALNLDDAVDGSVLTSNIEFIQNLNVSSKGIEDLTGIEDFEALLDLNVRGNALKTLNISGNRNLLFLWAENNQLTQLVIGNNPNIEKLGTSGNQLTTLKVTEYTTLQLLDLANNQITAIDVSTLPLPTFNEFKIEGNPLTCIQVSPEQLQNIPASWTKDEEDTYSPDCE